VACRHAYYSGVLDYLVVRSVACRHSPIHDACSSDIYGVWCVACITGSATAEKPRVIPDAMVPRFAAAPTASCWKEEFAFLDHSGLSHTHLVELCLPNSRLNVAFTNLYGVYTNKFSLIRLQLIRIETWKMKNAVHSLATN
jgi:hypothetical protein